MRNKASLQGPEQLEKEVALLSRLEHKNLVRLIGYCIKEGEMLLVYEYMSNISLERHLFGNGYCGRTFRHLFALFMNLHNSHACRLYLFHGSAELDLKIEYN